MRKAFKILAVTTLALTLALPFTAYASQWIQSTAGWKVQADDGSYLTNQWYQSPESGLFYYMGADGYMMVNTVTPDGYYVNAKGVWVEQPVTQPTQFKPVINEPVQNNDTDDTLTPEQIAADEEFKRQLHEAAQNGGEINDVGANGGHAGYDDTGEINIGGY
ncbi:hypothetical protein [Enterocloster bolteae]|uniref:hypothetical protein n=1 Tax=Enterocloster bolteae TaxID=208479 RepID=UPI00210D71B0|nr:hypothetical protein [Enterocloster bolteae]MCQ5144332.1 hypothetical protein [Enterocloster bolteae]